MTSPEHSPQIRSIACVGTSARRRASCGPGACTNATSALASIALSSTSRRAIRRTIVTDHWRHSHDRRGLNCRSTGSATVDEVAASASARSSSSLSRTPASRSPPLIATGIESGASIAMRGAAPRRRARGAGGAYPRSGQTRSG